MRMLPGGVAFAMVGAAFMASAGAAQAQKKDRNLITREEIMASSQKDGDLHQAIRSLRPHFLAKPRGQRTMDVERGGPAGMQVGGSVAPEPAVYVNGNKVGELNMLKNILAADAHEVKYLDPTKAQEAFGIEANGGAVLVTLVKGIKDKP